MQKYTEIDENKTLRESRELLLNNDKTAISCNSGPAFPTINLQPGMLCFRTDEQKLYQLNADGKTWIELFDLSGNKGLVSRATTADNALKANGHTVNADVPVNAKFTDTTYGAVTDSASGLMTAAQKKKLDGIAAGANKYSHPNSGVSAGTYALVTVNAQGHVTAGSNPTTNNTLTLVESRYNEDGSWYRKYSDGWLEQGGKCLGAGYITVNLLKPYKNTNYIVLKAFNHESEAAISTQFVGAYVQAFSKTNTSFKTYTNVGATTVWYACGQS